MESIDLRKTPVTSNRTATPASNGNVCNTITIDRDEYKLLLGNYNGVSPFKSGAHATTFEVAVKNRIEVIAGRSSRSHDDRIMDIILLHKWIQFTTQE